MLDKINKLAKRVAEGNNVELLETELLGKGPRTILKVIIDKEEGISLRDCEIVSRELEALLDVEDPVAGRYTLEVSSPGLDRPLKNREDFIKYEGKKIRVIIDGTIDNQSFFIGEIKEVHKEDLVLNLGKRIVTIPFGKIKRAKLEIEIR